MDSLLAYAWIFPTVAFAMDLLLLIQIGKAPAATPARPQLFLFYACVGWWNLCVLFLLAAPNADVARRVLYPIHLTLPWIYISYYWTCVSISGRAGSPIWRAYGVLLAVGALILLGLVNYSFWFTPDDTFYIREVRRFPWGHYPVGGIGPKLLNIMTLAAIPVATISALFPRPGFHSRSTAGLFLLFWLGLGTNYLPVHGIDILPLGNALDAGLSFFIVRTWLGSYSSTWTARLLVLGALLCPSLVIAYLMAAFVLPVHPVSTVTTALAATVAALWVSRYVSLRADSSVRALPQLRLSEAGLTPQELRICKLVARGLDRRAIENRLQITAGTLRIHLKSIYAKTIEKGRDNPSPDREKLQRLTTFLHALEVETRDNQSRTA